MDHSGLTRNVDEVAALPASPPALPSLQPVPDGPLARAVVAEPMVNLSESDVACLAAYFLQRLPWATSTTLVRKQVAERLRRVDSSLPSGLSLAVFDAWRPSALQAYLLDYAKSIGAADYVSPTSQDPRRPPPHVTGGAVDLTLALHGEPLALGTAFDDFTPAAHTTAFEDQPGNVRDYRRLLYWAMREQGFVVHELEWWHFEFGTRRWAALTGEEPRYGAWEPED